jgi:UDP-N-acetylglucosamine transferase subunit ALG13
VTPVAAGQLLLVTVGTDHHPFDRLVRWVDAWFGSGRVGVRCLMQTGTSAPPAGSAAWQAYLEFDALQAAMREATVVVCHGGPGTILGARHAGAIPVVVPRQARLSEHVDDHQVLFTRRLADAGGVFLAESEAGLHALLDRAVAEPAAFRAPFLDRGLDGAVRSFQRLVDDLIASPRAIPSRVAPTASEKVVP